MSVIALTGAPSVDVWVTAKPPKLPAKLSASVGGVGGGVGGRILGFLLTGGSPIGSAAGTIIGAIGGAAWAAGRERPGFTEQQRRQARKGAAYGSIIPGVGSGAGAFYWTERGKNPTDPQLRRRKNYLMR